MVVGQWASDGSWYYDAQLAIEGAEIGGTLIALSVPALKPLLGSWFSRIKATKDESNRNDTIGRKASFSRRESSYSTVDPKAGACKESWTRPVALVSLQTSVSGGTTNAPKSNSKSKDRDSDEDLLSHGVFNGNGGINVHMSVRRESIDRAQ